MRTLWLGIIAIETLIFIKSAVQTSFLSMK